MIDEFDLRRFVEAQEERGTYKRALGELRAGRKTTHWMWFIFPQIAGLGQSFTSQHFAISGLEEARAYLAHPVLGPRLGECVAALLELETADAVEVLGPVDAQKLRSSMTLFATAAPGEPPFRAVLDRYFAGMLDSETTVRIAEGKGFEPLTGVNL